MRSFPAGRPPALAASRPLGRRAKGAVLCVMSRAACFAVDSTSARLGHTRGSLATNGFKSDARRAPPEARPKLSSQVQPSVRPVAHANASSPLGPAAVQMSPASASFAVMPASQRTTNCTSEPVDGRTRLNGVARPCFKRANLIFNLSDRFLIFAHRSAAHSGRACRRLAVARRPISPQCPQSTGRPQQQQRLLLQRSRSPSTTNRND
jgi:hypothetical protein